MADLDVTGIEAEAHLPGNLTDAAYAKSLPEAALKALGGLDILINNAVVMRRGPVTASSDEDFYILVGVNVKAPFQLCRAAIPLMAKAGGGAMVFTTQRGADAEFEGIAADFTDTASPAAVVSELISKAGQLDVLVNSAGMMQEASIENSSLENWQ